MIGTNCFRIAAASIALSTMGLSAAADLTIADLAPRNSIAVFAVDDYSRLRDAFDRSPYAALLKEPEVKAWLHEVFEEIQGDVVGWIEEQGLKADDLPQPAGMLGAALWMDEDAASPMIAHGMIAIDMGDDADGLEDLIESILRRGEDEEMIRVLEDDIEEVAIREIEFLDFDEEMFADQLFGIPSRLFVARLDDVFYILSDREELANALDRARGADIDSLRDEPALLDATNIVAPAQLTMTVLARPFFETIDRAMKSDAGREAFGDAPLEIQPILQALGLSTIRAFGYGLELNARDAMAVTRMAFLTPDRDGIFELLDVPGGAFEPPAYLTADAAVVRQFRFDFAEVLPLLNQVIASLPDEQRFQMQAMAGMVAASVGPLLQTVGPEVVYSRSYEIPFSSESETQALGVRVRDVAAVNASLEQVGQMIGLERTEFQGLSMWESPGMTLGFAGEYAVTGAAETVRAALRQSVNAQAPRLSDEPRFVRAKAFTRPGGIYYSYTDTEAMLRYLAWSDEHWEQLMRDQLLEFGFDDETIGMWIEEERIAREEGMAANFPPVEVLLRHMGDVVSETHITADGVVSRSGFLSPRD